MKKSGLALPNSTTVTSSLPESHRASRDRLDMSGPSRRLSWP
ncbi:Uncharacterised protein [Mycobacteroides abscessus subsp. abscessus]|nr:Uncharacterised protein [Mycobacteroides abscessus subsp. abscessus]